MTATDDLDEIFALARQLDPEAWAARDRLWRARGVNPDRMDQVPRSEREWRLHDRRMRSMAIATDRWLRTGYPILDEIEPFQFATPAMPATAYWRSRARACTATASVSLSQRPPERFARDVDAATGARLRWRRPRR
jgi:hypothetical protein